MDDHTVALDFRPPIFLRLLATIGMVVFGISVLAGGGILFVAWRDTSPALSYSAAGLSVLLGVACGYISSAIFASRVTLTDDALVIHGLYSRILPLDMIAKINQLSGEPGAAYSCVDAQGRELIALCTLNDWQTLLDEICWRCRLDNPLVAEKSDPRSMRTK